jgi:uncharacterized membrane protein YdbT with pleckstrin-like domain
MTYVQRVLQPGEVILQKSRIHWIIYARGIAFIIFWASVAVALRENGANPGWFWLPLIGVGFGLLAFLSAWLRRWTTEIAVTNRRIIYKRGFISRRTIEMNMDKVESVDVVQSVLGRIFNFGTVIIRGTGAGIEPIRTLHSPLEFRNSVIAR